MLVGGWVGVRGSTCVTWEWVSLLAAKKHKTDPRCEAQYTNSWNPSLAQGRPMSRVLDGVLTSHKNKQCPALEATAHMRNTEQCQQKSLNALNSPPTSEWS